MSVNEQIHLKILTLVNIISRPGAADILFQGRIQQVDMQCLATAVAAVKFSRVKPHPAMRPLYLQNFSIICDYWIAYQLRRSI